MFKERLHINNQVFQDLQTQDWLHLELHGVAAIGHPAHQRLASQHIGAIDAQSVGTTHPMGAGTAQRQRAILRPFHLVQHIQHRIVGQNLGQRIITPVGSLVFFRIEAADTDMNRQFLYWRGLRGTGTH